MLSAEEIKYNLKTQQHDSDNDQQGEEFEDFYNVDYKVNPDGSSAIKDIKIDYFKLVNRLKALGIRRLDIGPKSYIVRIQDNVVEEVSQSKVIDIFVEWLTSYGYNLPDGVVVEQMLNKIYRSLGTYFSDAILNRCLNDKPIQFNEHDDGEAFFYYQNGFVRVSKDHIELLPYSQLKGYIWKNQMLPRDFKLLQPKEYNAHAFAQFFKNIADDWAKHPGDGRTQEPNPERTQILKNVVGYGLHAYFAKKLQAVNFTDARISDADEPNGRSGKTLILKAMGQMLNSHEMAKTYVEIDGKELDNKDRFKYQDVGVDTKLVHFNDIDRRFDNEKLFTAITEGIKVQYKNEKPFPVMAKIFVSSNKALRIYGGSARDRFVEVELADYYSEHWEPRQEFNHWFFTDWSEKDWYCFDNFMLSCVQQFLQDGSLRRPGTINLMIRKLREQTAVEFVQFMEDLKIEHLKEYDKKILLHDFKQRYEDFDNLKQRSFTKWMRFYSQLHPDMDGCEESRKGGNDFITFKLKNVTDAPAEAGSATDEEIPWLKD